MSTARGGYNKGLYYSNIVSPIRIDMQFTVSSTDSAGKGITSLKSNGYVQNVFMHTTATPASASPNPPAGQILIELKQNFNAFIGSEVCVQSPVTGSALAINGSALTLHVPYQITTVGAVPAPTFTVTVTGDTAGSLSGKYWTFADQYNNNYVVWYNVAGASTQPSLTGSLAGYIAIPVAIASGDNSTTVGGATRTALAAASNVVITGGTSSVIITGSLTTTSFSNLPSAGTSGFTVGAITYKSLATDWGTVGFPTGFTPSVGAAFFATATGGATNTTGRVKALSVSGIAGFELLGVSSQLISNSNIAANAGAMVMGQFLGATSSGTTTLIPVNPADTSVVSLSLIFDQSSVTVDGL